MNNNSNSNNSNNNNDNNNKNMNYNNNSNKNNNNYNKTLIFKFRFKHRYQCWKVQSRYVLWMPQTNCRWFLSLQFGESFSVLGILTITFRNFVHFVQRSSIVSRKFYGFIFHITPQSFQQTSGQISQNVIIWRFW